jgi:hypothetical protein
MEIGLAHALKEI